jgi:hypothetical protein
VEERAGEFGNDFAVNLADEIVGLRIGGSEDVSVRRLGEIGIDFVFQKLMKMSKGLLLGQKRDVVAAGVVDEFFDSRRGSVQPL